MTTCGTGGWAGPLPGDPGSVFGLSATPAFGGIQLSWNLPGTNPYAVAFVTVYRGYLPDFQYATKLVDWSGSGYFDQTGLGEPLSVKYYWVRATSVNGTPGDLIGPASATARATITQTIEMLTGQIDEGVLAQTLKTKIGEIELLGGSITDEVQARMLANQALTDLVGDLQGNLTEGLAIIEEVRQKQVDDNGALVQALDLYAAGFGTGAAGVSDETKAWVNSESAVASRITTAETSLNGNVATGQVGLVTTVGIQGNKLVDIGARWTAIVDVNGMIGGFGVYNNGQTVEAGFDVDLFWVGRTTNKIKPFIITGGEVFIKKAVIGTVTADMIDTQGLVLRGADGNPVFTGGSSVLTLPSTVGNVPSGWLNSNLTSSITAAKDAGDNAQISANNANTAIENIVSDNVLSKGEKPQVIINWNSLIGEFSDTLAKATSYGVTTEKTNYDIAVTVLGAYLSSLTPAWSDSSQDTPIVGATFRANWTNVYSTRQLLLNKIAEVAGTRASWSNIVGQANAPANNATANQSDTVTNTNIDAASKTALWTNIAGQANAPASNATVGAPSGTYVGSVLAQNVESIAGAQAKADAARDTAVSTAASAAQAKADLAVTTANAYADGIVSPAEARAIAAAQVKADAAQVAAVAAAALDASAKANLAATTALWSNIAGQTNAPANNATVGAPSGTPVGNSTADTVVSNASQGATAFATVADITSDNKLTPSEKSQMRIIWDDIIARYSDLASKTAALAGYSTIGQYNSALGVLGTALNAGSSWTTSSNLATVPYFISDAQLSTTSDITGSTIRANWASVFSWQAAVIAYIQQNWLSLLNTVNNASTGLATKLVANAQNILSGPGGVATGNLTWDSAGNYTGGSGVGFSAKGIVGATAGVVNFTLNGTTGDAMFNGDVYAKSFTGNVIDTGNLKNNAATILSRGYSNTPVACPANTNTDILLVPWTSTGATVVFIASTTIEWLSATAANCQFAVLTQAGTTIWSGYFQSTRLGMNTATFAITWTNPPAGAVSLKLRAYPSLAVEVYNTTLVALESKK